MNKLMAAALAGATMLAIPAVASAQECRGGYKTLGNGVIVTCDSDTYYREAAPYYAPAPQVYIQPRVYVQPRPYYSYDYYSYNSSPRYYDRYPRYSNYGNRDRYRSGNWNNNRYPQHNFNSGRDECQFYNSLAQRPAGGPPPGC